MAEPLNNSDAPQRLPRRPFRDTITGVELVGGTLAIVWLTVSSIAFLRTPNENQTALDSAMTLMAILLPVALIWVAISSARSSRMLQEEARRLQAALDGMRQSYLEDRQLTGQAAAASVEKKLAEIAAATKPTETAVATFATSRSAPARQSLPAVHEPIAAEEQPKLELGTTAEEMTPRLDRDDMIRALNFPDTEQDEIGFAALRRALKERQARQLIQASQDVLTLLSQDGIYMDDLRPDRARPEIWRRFAKGERGRVIASLGGVRDRSSLALTSGRMREDPIFRDASHHFLRLFDRMLAEFEEDASDEQVSNLSETRSARAFMLLGRVAGTFD